MPQVVITIKGSIDEGWSDYFADLLIQHASSHTTILRGQLADQAALYDVLSRLSSLGLGLISVRCQDDVQGTKSFSSSCLCFQ
ncbi:MAG: hypothetical protein IH586_23500 [Anaerolineaceae bacterium]|nr:hypothetical protein [Anaerolineaceae bacterium]